MENPSLPLDPGREDKDAEKPEGEQGKDDPKGSVTSVSRVQEPHIRVGLR